MASWKSLVRKTAFLFFTKNQEENCEKLQAVLESESNGDICINDLVCHRVEELRTGCDCIVLICSLRATELINKEESSVFIAKNVKFDGKIISKIFKRSEESLRCKVVPVSFVELPGL